jgi:hypothetical protein
MANKNFNKAKDSKPKVKSDSDIAEDVQQAMIANLNADFAVADENMKIVNKGFDDYYDMVHCRRAEKSNDWESDICLPEFTSRLLTQIGNFMAKYFGSRDYVETDEDTEDPKVVEESKAAKTLLNTLLNDKNAYYFQKIVRLLMFVWPSGWGVIKGSYRQKVEQYQVGNKSRSEAVVDEEGNYLATDGGIYEDTMLQTPQMNEIQEPIYDIRVIEDKPEFDLYPNQNVYFSPEYAYSLKTKDYVVFENDDKTLDELRLEGGYFNLDLLEDKLGDHAQQQGGGKTYNKDGDFKQVPNLGTIKLRLLEWWRKYPVVVKQRDENGKVVDYEIGIDSDGNQKEDAELVECILTTASPVATTDTNTQHELIGFEVSKHSSRPMVRFLCYVDAINDSGFGDGELTRELQIGIDDNFNLGNFRTKLATTPAFKGRKFSGIPERIKVGPEEAILVDGDPSDLQELQISDNIQGTMVQNSMLSSRMDFAMATGPQTMGASPENRETATQASIVSQRAEIRIGMKTTNLEFIGFTEFYDMILTLCNDFMLPQTLENLIGDAAYNYNPRRVNKFRPVSQALETEESKRYMMRTIDQIIGRIVNFPNPKTPLALNYLLGMFLEAAGKNFKHFKKFMFSEDIEANTLYQLATGGQAAGLQPPQTGAPGGGPSNQMGMPQSAAEQNTRTAIGG